MLVKGFIPPAPFKGGEGYAQDTARTCCSKRLKPIKRRRLPRSGRAKERPFFGSFFGRAKKEHTPRPGAKPAGEGVSHRVRQRRKGAPFFWFFFWASKKRTYPEAGGKTSRGRRFPQSPAKAERSALFLVLILGEQKKNIPRGRGQKQQGKAFPTESGKGGKERPFFGSYFGRGKKRTNPEARVGPNASGNRHYAI
ncbi:MAG: hypothetical protein KIPDCIKN_02270 [Haliscomenobacter sp.]|nr:hypothetical protein [Haliscomenobacter sp.]